MAKQRVSKKDKILALLQEGMSPTRIAAKLKVSRQYVYSTKYLHLKEQGLGSLGKATPKPTDGVGKPPRRKAKGTGIKAPAPEIPTPYMPITMIEPELTLFDKVRERFRNIMLALGGRV